MTGILKLAQLVEDDRVAEVQVGSRGIHAELDAQRPPLPLGEGELLFEGAVWQDLDGAHHQVVYETRVDHVVRLRCRVTVRCCGRVDQLIVVRSGKQTVRRLRAVGTPARMVSRALRRTGRRAQLAQPPFSAAWISSRVRSSALTTVSWSS